MSEEFSRPFEYLEELNGEKVVIRTQAGETVRGTQECFDEHTSLLLRDVSIEDGEKIQSFDRYFLRGNSIKSIRGVGE